MSLRSGVLSTKCTICGSLQKRDKKKSFFPFPRDLERCRAWIKAVGLLKLVVMPLSELYEQVVCDTHFPRGCFNKAGTRLHNVALPTLSRYRPLSDSITASWPSTFNREVNPMRRNVTSHHAAQINQPESIATLAEDNDINYDQPLMTCVQTINNKVKHVKKPAGVLNTISVPLLTYTSSLERGTIFAANEPKSIDLAKLPQLHAQYKSPAKEFGLQNKEAKYLSTTKNKIIKKNHIIRYASSPIPGTVLSGKDARSMRIKMAATKTSEAAELPLSNTEPCSQNFKGIQYNRSSIHSLLNESLLDKDPVLQYKAVKKNKTAKLSNSAHQLLQKNKIFNLFTPAVKSANLENREITPLSPKLNEKIVSEIVDLTMNSITEDPNYTEMENSSITELGDMASFTPGDLPLRPRGSSFEQHAVNELPESTNVHVEECTQELCSPLFKPTDTISKGKINYYRIPTDVPLLNCMKILDY